jgi:hypothetical protein
MLARMNPSRISSLLLLVCTVSFVGGCASLTQQQTAKDAKKSQSKWPWSKEKEYQMPRSMAVIWSPDVFVAPGATPSRGFGGRIYFYNEKSQAVPVDGELVVHGYDETTRQTAGANPAKADKTYRFTSEQFTQHFSESQLGASYSIWIPWDQEAEGTSRKIVLIPTFIGKDGKVVRGESSQVVLQGTTATEPQAPQDPMAPLRDAMRHSPDQGSPVQAASYHADILRVDPPDHANRIPSSGLRTTTISIPSQSGGRNTPRPAPSPTTGLVIPAGAVYPAFNAPGSNNASAMDATWQTQGSVPQAGAYGSMNQPPATAPGPNPPMAAPGASLGAVPQAMTPAWGKPWPQVDHRPMQPSRGIPGNAALP